MAIKVARGVLTRIREDPGHIVLQVQGASDPEAAAVALGRARHDVWRLDAGPESAPGLGRRDRNNPSYVAEVMPAATGPFITIDGGHVPYRLLRTIPDIVARHLAEAGVEEAVVAAPAEGGPLDEPHKIPRAAVLRLFPPPPHDRSAGVEIPAPWLDEAVAWVGEGVDDDGELWAAVEGMQFPLAASGASAFLAECRAARTWVSKLVSGDLSARIRSVTGCFPRLGESNLGLAAGGPAATDDDLLTIAERLEEVARRLAGELAYAFVNVEPNFGIAHLYHHFTEWYREGGETPERLESICDELVFDAFPYQVLGPGHLERLGGPPPGAVALAEGRMEVAIGEPSSWLPGSPDRGEVQASGRELLTPCLLRSPEAGPLVMARWAKAEGADWG